MVSLRHTFVNQLYLQKFTKINRTSTKRRRLLQLDVPELLLLLEDEEESESEESESVDDESDEDEEDEEEEEEESEDSTSWFCVMIIFGAFFKCSLSSSLKHQKKHV